MIYLESDTGVALYRQLENRTSFQFPFSLQFIMKYFDIIKLNINKDYIFKMKFIRN